MPILDCYDDTPSAPGEEHGPKGPTHCASIRVDYAYQAEMWVQEIEKDQPEIVRIECEGLKREWKRNEAGKMVEVIDVELLS